jgi:hypothetical protein
VRVRASKKDHVRNMRAAVKLAQNILPSISSLDHLSGMPLVENCALTDEEVSRGTDFIKTFAPSFEVWQDTAVFVEDDAPTVVLWVLRSHDAEDFMEDVVQCAEDAVCEVPDR